MATSREESSGYDGGGLGAGGKFKKRPFRRTTVATPYDRPPTAFRNPVNGNGNSNGNGWLSKFFDPAQRLISYSANKLFASVFRERLPPPPPPRQSPEPGTNQETREIFQEVTCTEPLARQDEALDRRDNNHTDGSKYTELEHILKQKTFSRAEIDRLTSLLLSRTPDNACGVEEERSEAKLAILPDRKNDYLITPIRENGPDRNFTATPVAASNLTKVLDEDIASPAELAKAYMGSQPYKVSESRLTFRSQPHREDFHVPSNSLFTSKSPVMSFVPRSSGQVGTPGNGYVLPRSRGRSAIYSMARTPYSRTSSTAALKSAGHITDGFAGPSSSSSPHGARDKSRLSVARQVALKRRLDNDIGSVGPIRRIRQKSNLLSPRSLGTQASGSPFAIHEGGFDYAQNSLSLMKKPFSSHEGKDAFAKTSSENGVNISPSKSLTPTPSKSSQMASKILEQLNELVSTREKSPAKLSSSMLSGPALKSLENVDSSKLLENSQYKFDGLNGGTLLGIRNSTSSKQVKLDENSREKLVAPPDKSTPLVNGIGDSNMLKDDVPSPGAANSHVVKTVTFTPQQKKRGFQMSAQEDYLDLDNDGGYSNGGAPTLLSMKKEKLDNSTTESKNIAPEATSVERPPTFSETQPLASSVLNQKPNYGAYDGYTSAEKKASITSVPSNLPTTSFQPVVLASMSTSTIEKPSTTESSLASSLFNSGEGAFSPKEQTASLPTFPFGSANDNKDQSLSETSGFKFDGCLDPIPGSSNSSEAVVTAANHVAKSVESNKADDSKYAFSVTPETASISVSSTSSPAGNIFKFGGLASNGSLASSNSPFSCSTAANGLSAPISADGGFSQASVPSVTSASATEFTGSNTGGIFGLVLSADMSNASSSSDGASSAVTSVGSSPFSSLASTTKTAGSSIFGTSCISNTRSILGGTSCAATSTGSSIFSSVSASTTIGEGSIFGFSTAVASSFSVGSGVATSSQSAPFQFASSAPLFGLTGNTTLSPGTSQFGSSSSASSAFGSGAMFGLSSSSSDSTVVSTSGAATNSLFGSNWAAPKTPPAFTSPFTFGASSTSVAGNTTPPVVFGPSNSASSGSIFPFTSATATVTTTHPVFGSTTPSTGFVFGPAPTPTSISDQMMDSMAEDTVQAATPSVPAFGQQPETLPSSGFVFGATPTPTPRANPFQLGGQPSISSAPQNPFQASSSQEFNAGGSFSLGSGGGDKSARKIVKVSRNRNRKK